MTTEIPPDVRHQVRALAAGLVTAFVLLLFVVVRLHGGAVDDPLLVLGAAVLFHLGDRFPIMLRVRDQSIANSATEFVQVLCLLWLPPLAFVLARVVGTLNPGAGFTPVKRIVNAAMLGSSTAITVLVVRALGGPLIPTEPRTWWAVLAGMVTGSLFEMVVLSRVLRLVSRSRSHVSPLMAAAVIGVAAAMGAVSLGAVVLVTVHPAGIVLALVPGGAVLAGMASSMRSHHELTQLRALYDLSQGLSRAPELEVALSEVVVEARAQLRCLLVELELRGDAPGDIRATLSVDERDVLRPTLTGPSVPGGTAAEALASWLAGAPATALRDDDAIVVPVRAGNEVLGVLVAHGRPPGRDAFRESDGVALQALGDHLGATVHQGRLSDRLRAATADRDYLANNDPLTGLRNRRWFVAELDRMVADGAAGVAVALLNIRGFRELNERVGKSVGDLALVEVAHRLREALPDGAHLARHAGDEFAVAVRDGSATELAEQLRIAPRLEVDGASFTLELTVGLARWPGEVAQASGLLRAADLALAAARRDRGPGVVHYDAALELAASRRSRLAGDLRRALQVGDLTLHYQPLVELATTTVVAAEALARWEHPEFGRVPPDEFVGIAEETGDVGHLTRWVLREAAAQAASWAASGHPLEVGVNVSAVDLEQGHLVDDVRAALAAARVDPHLLVLEITETAAMRDRSVVDRTLAELSAIGVQLAIDDFGTGHSSLAYLHALPVSEVKVDRAFVADVVHNAVSAGVVRAVTELARTRQLTVVAEGIEDEATRARLVELGVERGQGWYFGRPVPVDAFPLVIAASVDGSHG